MCSRLPISLALIVGSARLQLEAGGPGAHKALRSSVDRWTPSAQCSGNCGERDRSPALKIFRKCAYSLVGWSGSRDQFSDLGTAVGGLDALEGRVSDRRSAVARRSSFRNSRRARPSFRGEGGAGQRCRGTPSPRPSRSAQRVLADADRLEGPISRSSFAGIVGLRQLPSVELRRRRIANCGPRRERAGWVCQFVFVFDGVAAIPLVQDSAGPTLGRGLCRDQFRDFSPSSIAPKVRSADRVSHIGLARGSFRAFDSLLDGSRTAVLGLNQPTRPVRSCSSSTGLRCSRPCRAVLVECSVAASVAISSESFTAADHCVALRCLEKSSRLIAPRVRSADRVSPAGLASVSFRAFNSVRDGSRILVLVVIESTRSVRSCSSSTRSRRPHQCRNVLVRRLLAAPVAISSESFTDADRCVALGSLQKSSRLIARRVRSPDRVSHAGLARGSFRAFASVRDGSRMAVLVVNERTRFSRSCSSSTGPRRSRQCTVERARGPVFLDRVISSARSDVSRPGAEKSPLMTESPASALEPLSVWTVRDRLCGAVARSELRVLAPVVVDRCDHARRFPSSLERRSSLSSPHRRVHRRSFRPRHLCRARVRRDSSRRDRGVVRGAGGLGRPARHPG